jgi:hypothetical protein
MNEVKIIDVAPVFSAEKSEIMKQDFGDCLSVHIL